MGVEKSKRPFLVTGEHKASNPSSSLAATHIAALANASPALSALNPVVTDQDTRFGLTLDGLAEPWTMSHRMGGADISPDNAIEAASRAIARGQKVVDG